MGHTGGNLTGGPLVSTTYEPWAGGPMGPWATGVPMVDSWVIHGPTLDASWATHAQPL